MTTFLHRLAGAGGGARRGGTAAATGPTPALPLPTVGVAADDVPSALAADVRARLAPGEQDRYDDVVARHDAHRLVLARTLAATRDVNAVAALADVLAEAPEEVGRAVRDPVRTHGRELRQTDGTTCGSATLAALAATGDPTLALWLATGTVLPTGRPPELRAADDAALARLAGAGVERRAAVLQQVLKRRTNGRALGGLPWPAALGTPPWGAARTARFLGLRFAHSPLDDTDRPHLHAVLERVGDAVGRGVPVPLYAGGDTGQGWAAALPRHVVLVVGRTPDGLVVWEPSAGARVPVTTDALLAGDRPLRALGGWRHLVWALLPEL